MFDEKHITFHIIYTANTVELLSPLVSNLLKYSICNYNLVSNNCTSKEKKLLQSLCNSKSRLTYFHLPTNGSMWTHGDCINYLYKTCYSQLFCFMDSDILVTDTFLGPFISALDKYDAVFSGTSLWLSDKHQILQSQDFRVGGRHNITHDGYILGSSYFALYNLKSLHRIESAIEISWSRNKYSQLNEDTKSLLASLNLAKQQYDTGKLLNILMQQHSCKIQFIKDHNILHIGSISYQSRKGRALLTNYYKNILQTFIQHQASIFKKSIETIKIEDRLLKESLEYKYTVSLYLRYIFVNHW